MRFCFWGVFVRIAVDEISAAGLDKDYCIEAAKLFENADPVGDTGFQFVSPVQFHLHLQRADEMIRLCGDVAYTLAENCGRCLDRFEEQISSRFELSFSTQEPEGVDQEEIELEAIQLEQVSFSGDQLDLRDCLREQVSLSLPIRPLCRPECRGLCPECGGNLNHVVCGCEKKVFNNKFDALKALKKK